MPRAGRYRHRVTIEQPTLAGANIYGERVESWSTLATVWADVEPLSLAEREYAEQTVAGADFRVRMRYRSDVTADHRIIDHDSRTLNVVGVENVGERDVELVALCRQEVVTS